MKKKNVTLLYKKGHRNTLVGHPLDYLLPKAYSSLNGSR